MWRLWAGKAGALVTLCLPSQQAQCVPELKSPDVAHASHWKDSASSAPGLRTDTDVPPHLNPSFQIPPLDKKDETYVLEMYILLMYLSSIPMCISLLYSTKQAQVS